MKPKTQKLHSGFTAFGPRGHLSVTFRLWLVACLHRSIIGDAICHDSKQDVPPPSKGLHPSYSRRQLRDSSEGKRDLNSLRCSQPPQKITKKLYMRAKNKSGMSVLELAVLLGRRQKESFSGGVYVRPFRCSPTVTRVRRLFSYHTSANLPRPSRTAYYTQEREGNLSN